MSTTPSYWPAVVARAFTDSLLAFDTTPHLLLLAALGAVVTAALVLRFRGWKEFREHLIANILIAFSGAFATWLLVFAWIFIHLPAKTLSEANYNLDTVIVEKRQLSSETEQEKAQIAELTRQVQSLNQLEQRESPNSLRQRTIRLVSELNIFWSRRPTPTGQKIQNPGSDEERQRNAAWDRYWRDTTAAYTNADFRERILGIVRECKSKGIDTGYLEQGAEQPDRLIGAGAFGGYALSGCGQFMNDLCQLRELAYHVDGHDQVIILGSQSQTRP
jgi:hypothetical protein